MVLSADAAAVVDKVASGVVAADDEPVAAESVVIDPILDAVDESLESVVIGPTSQVERVVSLDDAEAVNVSDMEPVLVASAVLSLELVDDALALMLPDDDEELASPSLQLLTIICMTYGTWNVNLKRYHDSALTYLRSIRCLHRHQVHYQ